MNFGPKSPKKTSFNRPSTPSPRNVETWTFGKSGSFCMENMPVRLKVLQLFQNEQVMKNILPPTPKFFEKVLSKKYFDVEKWIVRNRLKRVLAKFEADRSHPRGVNGRSKLWTPTVAFWSLSRLKAERRVLIAVTFERHWLLQKMLSHDPLYKTFGFGPGRNESS